MIYCYNGNFDFVHCERVALQERLIKLIWTGWRRKPCGVSFFLERMKKRRMMQILSSVYLSYKRSLFPTCMMTSMTEIESGGKRNL